MARRKIREAASYSAEHALAERLGVKPKHLRSVLDALRRLSDEDRLAAFNQLPELVGVVAVKSVESTNDRLPHSNEVRGNSTGELVIVVGADDSEQANASSVAVAEQRSSGVVAGMFDNVETPLDPEVREREQSDAIVQLLDSLYGEKGAPTRVVKRFTEPAYNPLDAEREAFESELVLLRGAMTRAIKYFNDHLADPHAMLSDESRLAIAMLIGSGHTRTFNRNNVLQTLNSLRAKSSPHIGPEQLNELLISGLLSMDYLEKEQTTV